MVLICTLNNHGFVVYLQVFSGCGQPRFGRKKRAAEAAAASYEDFSFGWKPDRRQQQVGGATSDAVITQINAHLK